MPTLPHTPRLTRYILRLMLLAMICSTLPALPINARSAVAAPSPAPVAAALPQRGYQLAPFTDLSTSILFDLVQQQYQATVAWMSTSSPRYSLIITTKDGALPERTLAVTTTTFSDGRIKALATVLLPREAQSYQLVARDASRGRELTRSAVLLAPSLVHAPTLQSANVRADANGQLQADPTSPRWQVFEQETNGDPMAAMDHVAMGHAPPTDAKTSIDPAQEYSLGSTLLSLTNTPPPPGTTSGSIAAYCPVGSGDTPMGDHLPNGCGGPPSVGDPISLTDGSFWMRIPCLTLGGAGLPIRVGLHYDTHKWVDGIGSSAIGVGWVAGYGRRLQNVSGDPVLTLEDGSWARFPYINGTTYASPQNHHGSLTRDPQSGEFTLLYRDGAKDIFSATGRLMRVEDRLGNATLISDFVVGADGLGRITLTNNRTGQSIVQVFTVINNTWKLTAIRDGDSNASSILLREITLTYGTSGDDLDRLVQVTDAANRTYKFSYDSRGRINRYWDPNNSSVPAVMTYFTPGSHGVYDEAQVQTQTIGSRKLTISDTFFGYGMINAGPAYGYRYQRAIVTENVVNGQTVSRTQRFDHGLIWPAQIQYLGAVYAPSETQYATRYSYDERGNLARVADQLGRATDYIYDAQNNLTEVRAYHDTTYTTYDSTLMAYNSYGQMTQLTDPTGLVTSYVYNSDGTLQQTITHHRTDPNQAQITSYTYDPVTINGTAVLAGLPTAATLPDGTVNTQTYNSLGYPATTTFDADRPGYTGLKLTETSEYDWRGFLAGFTDRQGVRTAYLMYGPDSDVGLPYGIDQDAGSDGRHVHTYIQYDNVGNVTRTSQKQSSTSTSLIKRYSYDRVGPDSSYVLTNVLNSADASQNIDYTYTPFGELASVIEHNLDGNTYTSDDRTTSYTYTPQGWLDTVIAPDGRVLADYDYNAAGQVISQRDAAGATTTFTYDGKGRIATRTEGAAAVGSNPAINATYTYSYDAADNITQISGPNSWKIQSNYTSDPYGRLAWTKDALGNQTMYQYDDATTNRNRVIRMITGANVTADKLITDYSYDSVDRLTATIVDPGSGHKNLTTSYSYDVGGSDRWNLQRVTNPKGSATTYAYNTLGLLASVTDALGATTQYTYDDWGALTQITPAVGAPTTYSYDLRGRLTSLSRNGQTESWTYRADGSVSSYTGFNSYISYSYDAAGRLINKDYAGTASDPTGARSDATFTYTANDLLASATSKPNGSTSETTTYSYDAANRLRTRSRNGKNVTYGYNTNSSLTSLAVTGLGSISYSYDAAARPTKINPWGLGATTYSYRATGLLKTAQRPNTGATLNNVLTSYSYDTASRLTGITHSQAGTTLESLSYTLDPNGNRTKQTDVVTRPGQASPSTEITNYTYDALQRLTKVQYPAIPGGPSATTINHTYDAVGNRLTTTGQPARTYDASDRISGFSYDNGGNLLSDGSTTYTYDAANRLKTSVAGGVTTEYQYDALGNLVRQISGGLTTDYLLDETGGLAQVVAEVRSDGTQTGYAYGPDGLHARKEASTGASSYVLTDGLGSVRAWTSGANGSLLQSLTYDAWGNLRQQSGSNPAGGTGLQNGLGYTGEQQRSDGTVNLRARAYSPALGTFLQRDTFAGFASDPLSLNRYAYTQGNPVNWTDPTGHNTALIIGGVLLIGGAAWLGYSAYQQHLQAQDRQQAREHARQMQQDRLEAARELAKNPRLKHLEVQGANASESDATSSKLNHGQGNTSASNTRLRKDGGSDSGITADFYPQPFGAPGQPGFPVNCGPPTSSGLIPCKPLDPKKPTNLHDPITKHKVGEIKPDGTVTLKKNYTPPYSPDGGVNPKYKPMSNPTTDASDCLFDPRSIVSI